MGERHEQLSEIYRKDLLMICAIFERRPRTQRSIRDNRAARPVGTIKLKVSGRDMEVAKAIMEEAISQGYRPATPPYKTVHKEWDWVLYVHQQDASSPLQTAQKKKPVRVGSSSSMISRRLPLPTRRQRAPSQAATKSAPEKRVSSSKETAIPPRKRPIPSNRKRFVGAKK